MENDTHGPSFALPIVAGGGPGEGFVVVDKPAGLLSTPGKGAEHDPAKADCVSARVRAMFPRATGPLVVHRLDMDTSGLMVLGLTPQAQRALSGQFERRQVVKGYIALLAGHHRHLPPAQAGAICLPMRLDVDRRPRQVVDLRQGRPALTRYRVVDQSLFAGRKVTRVALAPITGRSHQLRVHTAHSRGLAAPIIGDALYGEAAGAPRLMLHATSLAFSAPATGERVRLVLEAPF